MSIKKKIVLILAGVVASFSIVQYGIEQLVVLPSFIALQQVEAEKDIKHISLPRTRILIMPNPILSRLRSQQLN